MNKTNKSIKVSFAKTIQFQHYSSISYQYQGAKFDRPISLLLILILAPLFILNLLIALFTPHPFFLTQHKTDALNRHLEIHYFSFGLFPKIAVLIDILMGRVALCGIPMTHTMSPNKQFKIVNQIQCKAGIFSLYDLHKKTGLTIMNEEQLLIQQLNGTSLDYLTLLAKSITSIIFYGASKPDNFKVDNLNNVSLPGLFEKNPRANNRKIQLFGLPINNTSMDESVNWIVKSENPTLTSTASKSSTSAKLAFFINVNSINLSISQPEFFIKLSKANKLFADGSGMRLAAKKAGFILRGNNNGTDLLPHLCRSCIDSKKSLYFLGAKPGIAAKAASNLQNQFPGLNIAGTEHGFNLVENTNTIITTINASQCDILLVALGSPLQEQWLLKNKEKLQCKRALAVGGLFDFYSGSISRSPLWLRELGLEWVWRLIQEPKNKFIRYVVGNPLFLYRTFFLNLVNTGAKK
jgi:N-acetylglucosaminyldiphosphoundecaprenol N-acetyl-beta-D-mannosaminyltransferase